MQNKKNVDMISLFTHGTVEFHNDIVKILRNGIHLFINHVKMKKSQLHST